MTFTITVNADIQKFAQNVHARDWRVAAGARKKAYRLGRAAWRDAGSPRADRQVRISVIVRRARLIDYWNIPGACKSILDGFCCGQLHRGNKGGTRQRIPSMVPDDSPTWVRMGTVEQEIDRKHKGREQIVFIVEPIGESMLWDSVPDTGVNDDGEEPVRTGRGRDRRNRRRRADATA